MKTIFSVILMFAVCSLYAQKKEKRERAQDDVYATGESSTSNAGNQAPKKTYKIIVKNELSADDNFKLVGQTLIENGYTIEAKDKEFYTIKAAMRPVPKSPAVMYSLSFIVKDKAVIVSGKYDLILNGTPTNDSRFDKIENKGMRGSPTKDAYLEMENFASKLGTTFEYVTE